MSEPMSSLEAVRRRPEMYFDLHGKLMNQYVAGAACLALAEVHCGSATRFRVEVDGPSILVEDDGGGVRIAGRPEGTGYIERMMTELFACRDDKEHEALKHELCGAGLAAVNAVAKASRIETVVNGTCWVQSYQGGATVAPVAHGGSLVRGTRLDFQIDEPFRGSSAFDPVAFRSYLEGLAVDLSACEIEVLAR